MTAFLITEAEWDALREERPDVFKVYCAIRRVMDYGTGVAGITHRISETMIREAISVPAIRGRHEAYRPTRQQVRHPVQRLVSLGLLVPIGALVFELPYATSDKSVSRKSNRSATNEQPDEQPWKNKKKQNGYGTSATVSFSDDVLMSNPHPESGNPEKLEPPLTPPESPSPSRFAEFWAAWPSGFKAGRKVCVTKWRAKKLDRIADEIIADVKHRQAQDERWLNGYIPNPATYLNQERWNDDIRKPNSNGGSARKLSAAQRAEQSEREFIAEQRRKAAAQHHGPAVDPHEPDQRQPLDGEFWRSGEDRGPEDRRDGADRNGGSVGGGSGGFDSGGHQAGGRRNGARGIAAHHATGVQAGVLAATDQRTDPALSDGRRAEGFAAAATEQGQGRAAPEHDARLAAIWNAGGQRWG